MTGFDVSAYLDLFKEDVIDHIRRMTNSLLALEEYPSNRDPLDVLFRGAHTIKGSARMMGFGEIATVAHAMEDVLSALRASQISATPQIVSVLLSAQDLLAQLVNRAGDPAAPPTDLSATLEELAATLAPPAATKHELAPTQIHRSDAVSEQQGVSATTIDPSGSSGGSSGRQREFMRVPVGKVDEILNLAGELAIRRREGQQQSVALYELAQRVRRVELLLNRDDVAAARAAIPQVAHELNVLALRHRSDSSRRAEMVAELHAEITSIRMLPLSNVFASFPRAIRDLSLQRAKEVHVDIQGGDVELDKLIIEGIQGPLLHLVRNAVDHGIESPDERQRAGKPRHGTLRIVARPHGDRVEILVSDDGRGLDFARMREVAASRGLVTPSQAEEASEDELVALLFVPGFSTAERVTETSGRGVGMDAVRVAVAELGGLVGVHSRSGEGTTCVISLPLTLAFTRALLVRAGGQVLALPAASVDLVGDLDPDRLLWLQGRPAIEIADQTLPVVTLAQVVDLGGATPLTDEQPVVVAHSSGQKVAFAVDDLIGEDDIVVKSLGPLLKDTQLVSGGAILPDGSVALLMNVHALVHSSNLSTVRSTASPIASAPAGPRRILVVDDNMTTRELERGVLAAAGYRVDTAVDGLDALERLNLNRYDAVITDLEMPRMDGFDLTRTLRRDGRWHALPIVILTTLESVEDKQRGLEAGAQAFLLKGAFDQDSLIETVRRLVG